MRKWLNDELSDSKKKTTIKLSIDVRDKLAEIGNKDETFEDVIKRLIRRAESERSGEITTSKTSMIQYKRKKEFVEIMVGFLNEKLKALPHNSIRKHAKLTPGDIIYESTGIEYEYNTPSKKEGEWELDIKILKIYYKQKSYNPSEFFGVSNDKLFFSDEFINTYFRILSEIFIKEFGITKLKNFSGEQRLKILEWRKIYYENKLSEESFINDVEDILRNFADRKIDSKTKKQIEGSVVGH